MKFNGMRTSAYFIGNFLLDYLLFMIPTIGFILLLFPMKIDVFTENWVSIFLVMMCFGSSLIALTYLTSFLFSDSQKAFRILGTLYLIVGFAIPITMSSIILSLASDSMAKFITVILYIDPFYPFY
jgi:hypothetical protein